MIREILIPFDTSSKTLLYKRLAASYIQVCVYVQGKLNGRSFGRRWLTNRTLLRFLAALPCLYHAGRKKRILSLLQSISSCRLNKTLTTKTLPFIYFFWKRKHIFLVFSFVFFVCCYNRVFFLNSTAPCLVWVLLVILPWVSFHHRKLRNYHKFVVPHARHQVLSHLADLHQFIWGKKNKHNKTQFLIPIFSSEWF
jgi:hypothetical protein